MYKLLFEALKPEPKKTELSNSGKFNSMSTILVNLYLIDVLIAYSGVRGRITNFLQSLREAAKKVLLLMVGP